MGKSIAYKYKSYVPGMWYEHVHVYIKPAGRQFHWHLMICNLSFRNMLEAKHV